MPSNLPGMNEMLVLQKPSSTDIEHHQDSTHTLTHHKDGEISSHALPNIEAVNTTLTHLLEGSRPKERNTPNRKEKANVYQKEDN